ncbi:MAG: lytic murein transglycosylase B [Thiotrichales bacterium]|nr:lytic murein transglycosylase B [Thiotrichales bacterium]
MRACIKTVVALLLFFATQVSANTRPGVDAFIDTMVSKHGFDARQLQDLFSQARVSQSILNAISRPAERLPWHKYRKIFLREDRIAQGVEFWHENMHTLDRAHEEYGVPPQIIIAIIGVETLYGRVTGKYRVMDALTTLGFHYPKRAAFFRGQLEQYLLLTREQGIDPLSLKGSYAGAMGIPQFIPGSYRNYAADFDNDGKINIWSNKVDAIGSVARYFKLHGWQNGKAVAQPATVSGQAWKSAISKDLEPDLHTGQLSGFDIVPSAGIAADAKIKLIELEQVNGSEFWLGFENFYVITRYNHSTLYAMAVYQLSLEIEKRFQGDS